MRDIVPFLPSYSCMRFQEQGAFLRNWPALKLRVWEEEVTELEGAPGVVGTRRDLRATVTKLPAGQPLPASPTRFQAAEPQSGVGCMVSPGGLVPKPRRFLGSPPTPPQQSSFMRPGAMGQGAKW